MSATTDVRRVSVSLSHAAGTSPAGNVVTEIIAVEEVCPPGAAYPSNPFPHLILNLTVGGAATVEAGGVCREHGVGSLIALASGTAFVEKVTKTEPWHCRYALVGGPWAEQISQHLRERGEPLFGFSGQGQERDLFDELFRLPFAQPDGWQWRLVGLLALLYPLLWNEAQVASPHHALLSRLAAVLDADPDARPTPAELARHVGLSPRQLLYEFGKAAGEPLGAWIRTRRIALARRLLEQGQSVSHVAAQLGYANPYHFSRQFKAVTGVCPSSVSERVRRTRLHIP